MTLESLDIQEQKLKELQQIFPEIFEDGKINVEKLQTILGDKVDDSSEHYSFSWAGKKACYQTIRAKTNATLKVDPDKTIPEGDNVFIEGDNLEVLKLLQNAYHKKVKMIYIDPPYNKDKDFVYSDTWGDSIQNYLIQTDQLTDEGYTVSKTNSTGRRHTNWLNMMYPRLWLSRNLLKDDGVIFVSIDDDEVHNLRKIMDEIYGEENFVAQFVWSGGRKNDSKLVSISHEYVLCYVKSLDLLKENKVVWRQKKKGLDEIYKVYEKLKKEYKDDYALMTKKLKQWFKELPESHSSKSHKHYSVIDKNGIYFPADISWPGGGGPKYDVLHPATQKPVKIPSRGWIYSNISKMQEMIDKDLVHFSENENSVPCLKLYLKDKEYQVPYSIFYQDSRASMKRLRELMDKSVFDHPKDENILKEFIQIITKENDIVLDFFAGSGTTAHAVMALNQEDQGNRKYILVQLPETTDPKSEAFRAGYTKISDITKERIKRAMEKLDYKEGFKLFTLDHSNFQIFKEVKKRPNESYESIEKMLKMSMFHENILTHGAKELDIVYEIGLKNGFTLSAKVDEIKSENYNFITLSEEERVFYFSFDKEIKEDIVHDVPNGAKLICYEKALSTNVKLNLRESLDLEVL